MSLDIHNDLISISKSFEEISSIEKDLNDSSYS